MAVEGCSRGLRYAFRPHLDGAARSEDELWCRVSKGASTQLGRLKVCICHDLGQANITNLSNALRCQQDVGALQVPAISCSVSLQ